LWHDVGSTNRTLEVQMPNYSFRYIRGQSAPSGTVRAANDTEAYKEIDAYLAERSGAQLVPGTIYMTENRHVADPPLLGMATKSSLPPVQLASDPMDVLTSVHRTSFE
jgi:hypothetical protein